MPDDITCHQANYTIFKVEVEVILCNPLNSPVVFFDRLALISEQTKQRILPALADNNYLSIMHGETRKVIIIYPLKQQTNMQLNIKGWNVAEQTFSIVH